MKNNLKQIEFIDNVLFPIYGFTNICDYDTIVSIETLEQIDDFYTQINKHVDNIKKHFTSRPFSFHKSDNKIKTYQQGVSCLQKCLMIANIPYKIQNIKNIKILRLSENNKTLLQYIDRMSTYTMTDIRDINSRYSNDDFLKMITNSTDTYVSKVSYKKAREGVHVPYANIKNFKIDLYMKSIDDDMHNPLAQKAINFVFASMMENMFVRVNGCGMDSVRHPIKLGEPAIAYDMYIPSKYTVNMQIVPEFYIKIDDKFIDDIQVIITYETFGIKKKLQKQINNNVKLCINIDNNDNYTQITYDQYYYKCVNYRRDNEQKTYNDPITSYSINDFKVAVCHNIEDCMYALTNDDINADVSEYRANCDKNDVSAIMKPRKDCNEYHIYILNNRSDAHHSFEIKPINVDMNTFDISSIRISGYHGGTNEAKEIELEYEIVDDVIKIKNYTNDNPLFCDRFTFIELIVDIPKTVPHNNVNFVTTCMEQFYEGKYRRDLHTRRNMHMYDFIQFMFD